MIALQSSRRLTAGVHELALALLALGAAFGFVLSVFFFARFGWLGWGALFAMGSLCVSCWMLLARYLFYLGVHLRAAGKPRVELVDGGRLHFGRLAPGLWLAPDDVVIWESTARRQLFMLFRDPVMARGVRPWAKTWPRGNCLVLTVHDLTIEEMDLVLRWGTSGRW